MTAQKNFFAGGYANPRNTGGAAVERESVPVVDPVVEDVVEDEADTEVVEDDAESPVTIGEVTQGIEILTGPDADESAAVTPSNNVGVPIDAGDEEQS
jgi:hypothetical protein